MKIDSDAGDQNQGDDSDDECVELKNLHMTDVAYKYESSVCSSTTDGEQSCRLSPVPDDANSKSS